MVIVNKKIVHEWANYIDWIYFEFFSFVELNANRFCALSSNTFAFMVTAGLAHENLLIIM